MADSPHLPYLINGRGRPFSTIAVPYEESSVLFLRLLPSVWLARSSPDQFSDGTVEVRPSLNPAGKLRLRRLIAPPSNIKTCWLETCSKIMCKIAWFLLLP